MKYPFKKSMKISWKKYWISTHNCKILSFSQSLVAVTHRVFHSSQMNPNDWSPNLGSTHGNDENLNLKLKTNNTQNLREICSNQCSCDICKDASTENLSSITESRLDNKPNQENVNQSSKSTSVPTFGKYCKRCRLKINWHAQNDYKSNHTIWTGTLKQKLNNDNDPVI